ncbi:hypothetical protein DMP06_05795 [Slackia equolifaciens]|uniref:Uncharacterized protein n=1 Tax=Slackia equolifaciens TaxID=498718 RepID=A0A3N0B0B6_9ACTN|nr:hypothetical protein DMP06_05795 [Slackia equolifaciens]
MPLSIVMPADAAAYAAYFSGGDALCGASELYRVSVSAEDERTLRRELRALWEVMSENGIGSGRAHRWVGSRWNTSRAEGQSGRLPLDVGAGGAGDGFRVCASHRAFWEQGKLTFLTSMNCLYTKVGINARQELFDILAINPKAKVQ